MLRVPGALYPGGLGIVHQTAPLPVWARGRFARLEADADQDPQGAPGGELVNFVPALMICPACGAEGRRVIFRRAANATPTCSRCGSTLRRATQRDFEAHAAKTWGTAA